MLWSIQTWGSLYCWGTETLWTTLFWQIVVCNSHHELYWNRWQWSVSPFFIGFCQPFLNQNKKPQFFVSIFSYLYFLIFSCYRDLTLLYYSPSGKCVVCNKDIYSKAIKVDNKTYHPDCFTCSVCKKKLTLEVYDWTDL